MALKKLLEDAPEQAFAVSHADAAYQTDGLRPYATYRDLGFAAATGGLVQAQVIRLKSPCTDAVRQRHYHDVDLQMVYILKGMMKIEVEGQGEITMRGRQRLPDSGQGTPHRAGLRRRLRSAGNQHARAFRHRESVARGRCCGVRRSCLMIPR